MVKQKEIYEDVRNGFCFPVALFNCFPKIFNNDKNELHRICLDMENKNLTVEDNIRYFNEYIKDSNESLYLEIIKPAKLQFVDFVSYLNKNSDNKMILLIDSIIKNELHAVSYLGITDNNLVYFENANTDVIVQYCITNYLEKIKSTDNIEQKYNELKEKYTKEFNEFSIIDIKFLYESSNILAFVTIDENSKFRNFSSRLNSIILNEKKFDNGNGINLEEYFKSKR